MPRLAQYADAMEECGATAERMMHTDSDGALLELGVESDVDRKYLLLQLARLRARERLTGAPQTTAHLCAVDDECSTERRPSGIEMESFEALNN